MGLRLYDVMKSPSLTAVKKKYRPEDLFADEERADGILPRVCYGFSGRGELVCIEGISRATPFAPPSPPVAAYATEEGFFFYGEDQSLYRLTSLGFSAIKSFASAPRCASVNTETNKRRPLFFDGADWLLFDNAATTREGIPARFACTHYERLFVWDGEKLRFSSPADPFGWMQGTQEAGVVYLPSSLGEVVALISMNERLYLLRERGATIFRAFGDNRNFKAIEVQFPSEGVIGKTACCVGERLFFFASGGLYAFDGENVSLVKGTSFSAEEASFADGRYFASGTLNGEKCLFCYAVKEGRGTILHLNAKALSPFGFCEGDRWLKIVEGEGDQPLERVWDSGLTLFSSSSARKMLRKLSIEGEGDVSLQIYTERGKRAYSASLPDLFQTSLRGRRFGVRIVAHGQVKIQWLEVKFLDY